MKKKSIGIVLALTAIAVGVSSTSQARQYQESYNEYRNVDRSDYHRDRSGFVDGVAQGTGEVVEGTGKIAGNILTFGAISRKERREARRREREERRRNQENRYQENYNNDNYNN